MQGDRSRCMVIAADTGPLQQMQDRCGTDWIDAEDDAASEKIFKKGKE